jgi:archaellum component FlaC
MSLLDAFKKKEPGEVPDVTELMKNGMSDQDIIENLRQQGYDSTAIKNALVNASNVLSNQPIKQQPASSIQPQQFPSTSIREEPAPQMSAPQPFSVQKPEPSKPSGISDQTLDAIQQVLEQIIEEKWQSAIGDLNSLRTSVKSNGSDITSINDKITRLSQRIDSIQNTMAGKTEEYNKTLTDVNIELQAFEKVIDRLVPTISDSIRELRDLIDELKRAKSQ